MLNVNPYAICIVSKIRSSFWYVFPFSDFSLSNNAFNMADNCGLYDYAYSSFDAI